MGQRSMKVGHTLQKYFHLRFTIFRWYYQIEEAHESAMHILALQICYKKANMNVFHYDFSDTGPSLPIFDRWGMSPSSCGGTAPPPACEFRLRKRFTVGHIRIPLYPMINGNCPIVLSIAFLCVHSLTDEKLT